VKFRIKNNKILKRTYIIGILAGLCIFHAVQNHLYIIKDDYVPGMDEPQYLNHCFCYYKLIKQPSLSNLRNIKVDQFDAPLFNIPAAFTLRILELFNFDVWTNPFEIIRHVNTFYLILVIIGIYLVTSRLFGNYAGVLAAIWGSTFFSKVNINSRVTLQELVVMAITLQIVYFFILSDNFRIRRYTLILGLLIGLGIITKFACIIQIIAILGGGAVLLTWEFFQNKLNRDNIPKKSKIVNLRNIALMLILAGTLVLIYYNKHLIHLVTKYAFGHIIFSQRADQLTDKRVTIRALVYIWDRLYFEYGMLIFIPFLIGLIVLFQKCYRKGLIILFWLIGVYFTNSFVLLRRNIRFFIPTMPAVAIISTFWIGNIKRYRWRYIISAAIIILSFSSFYFSSWGKGPFATIHGRKINFLGRKLIVSPYRKLPKKDDIGIRNVLDIIVKDGENRKIQRPISILNGVCINRIYGQLHLLKKYSGLARGTEVFRNDIILRQYKDSEALLNCKQHVYFSSDAYLDADFVILKTGNYTDRGYDQGIRNRIVQNFNIFMKYFALPSKNFELIGTSPVPFDNTQYEIYKRIREPSQDEILKVCRFAITTNPEDRNYHYKTYRKFILRHLERKGLIRTEFLTGLYRELSQYLEGQYKKENTLDWDSDLEEVVDKYYRNSGNKAFLLLKDDNVTKSLRPFAPKVYYLPKDLSYIKPPFQIKSIFDVNKQKKWFYVGTPCGWEQFLIPEAKEVNRRRDYIVAYRTDIDGSYSGIYLIHYVAGNNSYEYHIPSTIYNRNIGGFWNVQSPQDKYDVPKDITRHSDGSFILRFRKKYTPDQMIVFGLLLNEKCIYYSPEDGISKIVEGTYAETEADGVKRKFIIPLTGTLQGVRDFHDKLAPGYRSQAFVNGKMTELDGIGGFFSSELHIVFDTPPPKGATIKVPVTLSYSVKEEDRVRIESYF